MEQGQVSLLTVLTASSSQWHQSDSIEVVSCETEPHGCPAGSVDF